VAAVAAGVARAQDQAQVQAVIELALLLYFHLQITQLQ
jgi:hypothetical protein